MHGNSRPTMNTLLDAALTIAILGTLCWMVQITVGSKIALRCLQ